MRETSKFVLRRVTDFPKRRILVSLIHPDVASRGGAAPSPVLPGCTTLQVRSTGRIRCAVEQVAREMISLDYPSKDIFAVRFALSETILNAIQHGHKDDSSKVVRI